MTNLDDLLSLEVESKGDFKPIPGGDYVAEITDAKIVTEKQDGTPATPHVNWEFTVNEGEFSKRKIWANNYMTPKAMGFLHENLAVIGSKVKTENELKAALDFAVGQIVAIKVSISSYQGKFKNEAMMLRLAGASAMSENDVP